MSGHYYIIGGGGAGLFPLFNKVARLAGTETPKVVYIDAAAMDQHEVTGPFEDAFLKAFPRGNLERLDLLTDQSEEYVKQVMESADVVYMNGGDERFLERAYHQYGLKKHLHSVYERGGCVGGISAGGITLSKEYVTARDNNFETHSGLGLIEDDFIVTAHMEREHEYAQRLSQLSAVDKQHEKYGAYGVGRNTALVFDSSGLEVISGLDTEEIIAFRLIKGTPSII